MTQSAAIGCECLKCGWEWTPKRKQRGRALSEPIECPSCKSRTWTEPKTDKPKAMVGPKFPKKKIA